MSSSEPYAGRGAWAGGSDIVDAAALSLAMTPGPTGIGHHRTVGHSFNTGLTGGRQPESAPSGRHGLPLPPFSAPGAESAPQDAADVQDAWFGSYGTNVSRVLSSARVMRDGSPLGTMVAESVIGADDRVEVLTTRDLPYRWTCFLSILAANGTQWLGTGWLAAPGLVVTAGHCVYLHNQGGWAARVEIQPGRNGGDAPLSFVSHAALSVSGWVEEKRPASDYGALVLSMADAEKRIGYFGYAALPDVQLDRELVNLVGYPVDKPAGTLWGHARALSAVTADELVYQNSTYGGMSGSPVIQWDGSDYQVLGIHNYGDLSGNRATRITPSVFLNLQAWARRHALPHGARTPPLD